MWHHHRETTSVLSLHHTRRSHPTTTRRAVRRRTPPQIKCELGRVRRNSPHIGALCSARHSNGVTGALLSGFRFCGSNSGCPTQLFWRFAAKRDSQPPREVRRISRRPWRAGRPLELNYNTNGRVRMDLAAASRLTTQTAQMHSRQRGLVRLRREYPPEFGQQSTIGPSAISETHPLIHKKMTHIHKQPPSPTNQLCSSTCLGGDEVR